MAASPALAAGCHASLDGLRAMLRPDVVRHRRRSLGADAEAAQLSTDHIGHHFSFVNRDAQCKELLQCIYHLEQARPASAVATSLGWDACKRVMNVPFCTGIPGIGKTRFAREAVYHVLKDKPDRSPFEQALVDACLEDRNIHLQCDCLRQPGFSDVPLQHQVASLLLLEFCKYRVDDVSALQELVPRVRVSILDAIRFILSFSPAGDDAVIIVNVDEAHVLKETMLAPLLREFVGLLLERHLRVFPIVTGVTASTIREALGSSSIGEHEISLPLLQQHHVVDIMTTLLPQLRERMTSRPMRMLTWWIGGVPRFLEYALRVEALCIVPPRSCVARDALAAQVASMTAIRACSVLEDVMRSVYERVVFHQMVLSNAFSLCALNMPVHASHILGRDGAGAPITIQTAQERSMLYFEHAAGDEIGYVRMPPLVLHWLSSRSPPTLLLFRHLSPAMTARDNESTVVTILMHRMQAFVQLNKSHCKLSQLGIFTHADFIPDVKVQLPSCFAVADVAHNVTAASFVDFARTKRADAAEDPTDSPVAFINKPQAPFADAFVLLPGFTVFVHEKQSVIARRAADEGEATGRDHSAALEVEYNKLLDPSRYGPHVFIYVTDVAGGECVRHNRYAAPPDMHATLMGSMCADMRRARVHASEAEAHAADACGGSAEDW